jgi:hypothetical protein
VLLPCLSAQYAQIQPLVQAKQKPWVTLLPAFLSWVSQTVPQWQKPQPPPSKKEAAKQQAVSAAPENGETEAAAAAAANTTQA